MPILTNKDITVDHLEKTHIPTLAKWLSDPRVLEFYEDRDNPFDEEKVEQEFFKKWEKGVHPCIVKWKGEPIGYIQFYKLDEATRSLYKLHGDTPVRYGIDQFIGEPGYWGQGIGQLLVSSMTDYLFETKKAGAVVMDPQSGNHRALACYKKCGYKKIRFLPRHEWHEGAYRDCWLIEKRAES
ncbi:GNAT family N-acetyltransferase [Alteribacter keqinensis]|uniref:N-acetyltransferase n=1 Tax=Alteribacter keqinensis TaxID=2483800 RepID=A0A3M7TL64_9BACI|nr:GNAT family N-acetyltransferase [Alteribacter keqinensis]RNA66277.1 N-acetyltransferase [Alteribacter keqinensis]